MKPDPDQIPEEDLLEHIVDHLCEEQAEAVAALSDSEIRRRAALGLARARANGFEFPEPITAFVTLMFLVAPDFDRHPEIAKVLSDRKAAPAERLKNLFARTKEEHWEQAAANSAGWDALA
ncbi:MAG: hypothetical protein HZB13_09055 [Acidobacteria bacterium]|nr:hypothetical protein [Acidobacteriota bacterium]